MLSRRLIVFCFGLFAGIGCYSQSCLPEGIELVRQGQVDSFPLIYPGCVVIEGNIYIGGLWEQPCTINNLDSLITIISCNGDLHINGTYGAPLNSLQGLSNLQSVGGNLTITTGNMITDLFGLQGLHTAGGDVIIHSNFLVTLQGLDNLDSIGGNLQLGTTSWLADLNGLNSLSYIGGDLSVDYNESLADISALSSLTCLHGDLEIYNNDVLTTLSGLHNIDTIRGSVVIDYNGLLPDLSGLENLSYIGGWLQVNANENLDNLQGLNGLEHIGEGLVVFSNPLTDLAGLETLITVGDRLQIEYCGWLYDLDVLLNLESIGGLLMIQNNASLLNLDGLGNINAGSINELYIRNNLALSSCDAGSICTYLAEPGGSVTIAGNAPGCNSPEEVLQQCSSGQPDNWITGQAAPDIYPNPAGNNFSFQFSSLESQQVTLKIYDVHGREIAVVTNELKTTGRQSLSFDVSILDAGIYFYRLNVSRERMFSGKLVVK
ncbi:MAG: T9SS type A sorting domain-containing protein [Bacteroidales bacterium]|jgi:hypothetical protein|nr:T9SS type A sorting domain-containing protein [Bacteroidales bacterium]